MSRRRFVFDKAARRVVEVPPGQPAPSRAPGPMVLRDAAAFVSPIDGSVVEGRTALRAHERRHGVRQLGNDWAGSEPPPAWWHDLRR